MFSPNTSLFGAHTQSAEDQRRRLRHDSKPTNLPFVQAAPMGRFGAKRPTCSMAEV